jgi:hypothetical protein
LVCPIEVERRRPNDLRRFFLAIGILSSFASWPTAGKELAMDGEGKT